MESDEEGKRMSLYGVTKFTPQEEMGFWKNYVWREKHYLSHMPGLRRWSRHEINEMIQQNQNSYFGTRTRQTVADVIPPYDRFFNSTSGYNAKMHRDDRKSHYLVGCSIHDEEKKRAIPLLSSSCYGSRLDKPLEPFVRAHVRKELVRKGFRYPRGTGILPITNAALKCKFQD